MPIYQSNGKTYNIPDAKVQDFLKARPDAKEHKAKESPTLGFGMRMAGERTNPEANTFDEQPDQKQPVGVLQSDTATPEQKQAAYSVPEAPTVQQTIASAKTTAANVPGKRTEEGMANYTKALQQTRELLSSDQLDEDQKREVLYQFTKNFGTLNPDENPDITSDASAYLNEHGAPSATARIEAGWNAVKDAAGTLPGLYGTWNAYKNGLPDKEDLSRIVEEGKKAIMPSNTTTQRKVKNYLGKTAQGQQDVKDEQAYMDYLDKQYEEMKANLEKFKKEKIDGKRAPGDAVTVMQQTSAGAMPQTRTLSDEEKAVPVSETWREDSNDYNVALQKLKGIEQLREQAKDAKEKGVLGQVIGEVKRNAGDLGMQLATFGTSKVAEGQAENTAMQRTGKEAMTRQANELRAAYDSKLAEQMTMGQAITQGGLQSLPFTEQFLVTGLGTGSVLKGSMAAIDKALATGGVKAAMKVALPEITIAAAQTAISPATYARAYEKANQDATQNGQPAGGMLDYLPKVLPEMFIENQTERFGELGEIMKAGGRAAKPLSRFGQIRNKLAHYTGVQGVWGEYGEEVLGNVENAALNEINMGDRQTTWQDVVDPKQNLVTFGTVLFSQMPMNTIAAGGYVASKANNKIQIYNIKKGYSKNVANMIDVFGENDAQNAMNLVNEIVDGGRDGSVDALKSAQALDKAIEDGDFTEQEKEAMLHYAMSYAPMKGLQKEKDDRSKPIREKAKAAIANMVNADMGSVVTVKTSPDGDPISIAGGKIAQNPDGTIDLANSTETVYYRDAAGRVQVLPTSSISEVVEIVPADQAVAQADQAIKESIDGRVDDEQADDYEVGDTAAFTLPGSTTSMAGQVQAIDGAGNYVIVAADGQPYTVAPRYMKPKDFNTMDNGDILIYTDENGNLKKATVVDGFNTPGVFVMDNGDKITPDAVQDLIKPTEGGVNNGLQERNGKEKVNNGGDANVPNAPAAAEVGAVDKRVSDSATPAAGNTEAENTEAISNDPYADFPKKKDGSLDTAKLTPAQALQYAENEQGEDFALESAKIAVQSLGKKRDRMQQQMQTEADIAARVSLKKEIDATEAAIQEYTDYAKARDNRFGEFIPNTFSQRLAAIGEPTTPQEAVAEWLAGGGKIRWSDKVTNGAITAQGFGAHLGYGNEERKKYLNVTDNKNGLTPEQLGEYLTDNDTQGLFSGMTGADATNVVLEVLRDANSRKTALDYLEQTRGAVEADNTEAAAEQQETEQSEPEWVPPADDEIDWGPMGAPATDEEIQNAPFELAPTEEQLTTFAEMEDKFETIRKSLRFARGTEREQLLKRKGELVRAFVKELVGDSKIVKVVDRGEGLRKEMASVGREASYDTVVKAGAKVKGVALTNGIVVINAEEATSLGGKNSVTDTLFHEHEHVLNDKDSSNIVEVMDNMTRQEMLDFVYSRGGAQVYNSYEDRSLADEVLAFGMGGLYATRGDIKAVAGNNAFLSNFLKQLYDGRRELQSGGLRGLQSGGRRELRASGNAGLQRTDGRRNVDDNNNGEAKGRATGEANGQKRGTYDSASLGADRRNDYSGNEGIDGGQSGHEGVGDNAVSGRASSERTVRGSKFEADDAGHVQLQAVYHGSPHDFEKFLLDKVGTGEGSRVFGYGIYTTEVEGVARMYANIANHFTYKGKTIDDMDRVTEEDEAALQVMSKLEEQYGFENAKKIVLDGYRGKIEDLNHEPADGTQEKIKAIESRIAFVNALGVTDFTRSPRNLYTINIPDDTGSNYLEWYKNVPAKTRNVIAKALADKKVEATFFVPEYLKDSATIDKLSYWAKETYPTDKGLTGRGLYNALSVVLNSDKAASEFLNDLGVAGIKYPVGSIQGLPDTGAKNYLLFNPNDLQVTDHIRFEATDNGHIRMQAVYHGSPHDFEKFTLDKVGTGEGGRSFGYGIYTTEVEDVARQYATQLRGQNKERIVYKGKTYGWSPEKTAYDTLQKMGSKTEAIADAKKWLEYVKKDNPSMIDFWEGVVSILKSSKKSDFGGYSTNLYTISIPDDTGSNYLDWTQPATKEQKDRILDELIKEPSASKWVQEEMLRAVDYKERTFSEEDTSALKKGEYRMSDDVLRNELDEYTGFDAGDGAFGYKRLITILGNDRAASALLSRAGFSGIKYPVGSLHGRKDDGTRNYVIFNDNDLRIDDHVRFSMEDGRRQEADYAELVSKLNSKFNEEIQQQIDGTQEKGHIYQLGNPSAKLRSTGIPDLPIELKANKLLEKSTKSEHSYDLGDIKNLVEAIQNPLAVFSYGDKTKAQNIIAEIQKNGKNFLVGLSLNPEINGKKLEVNSVRNVFPKDNAEWLNWISENKGLYIDKERVQKLIDQQRINLADVEYLDLNSIAKIVQEFKNSKISDGNLRFQAVQENVAPQQDADYMKTANTPHDLYFVNHPEQIKSAEPVSYDDNGKVIPLSERFKENNNDIRFELAGNNKDLVVLHNADYANILRYDEQGGIANPSMAVIDLDKAGFNKYGGVTFIAPKHILTGGGVHTFAGDAYSPTYPKVEHVPGRQAYKILNDEVEKYVQDADMRRYLSTNVEYTLSEGFPMDSAEPAGIAFLYLSKLGKNPEIITSRPYSKGWTESEAAYKSLGLQERLRNGETYQSILENDPEVRGTLIDLYKKEVIPSFSDSSSYVVHFDTFTSEQQNNILEVFLQKLRDAVKPAEVSVYDTDRAAKERILKEGLWDDMTAYARELSRRAGYEEKLFKGYTANGRKYVPNTIENASKLMNKRGVQGVDMGGGMGFVRSKIAPELKSEAAIKRKQGKLLKEGEDLEEISQGVEDRFDEMAALFVPAASRGGFKVSSELLADVLAAKSPKDEAASMGVDLTDQQLKDLAQLKKDIIDLPTDYFEAAFTRPVYLREFRGALLPSTAPSRVEAIMRNNGIPVRHYDENKGDAERRRVLDDWTKELDKERQDIRFDVENDTPDNTEDLQKAIDYRSKKDRFFSKLRENYQERYLPVKKLYDELEKEGVEIKDFENLYLMQKGVAGKNQAEIEQFKNQYFQPMIEAINKFMKRGFTLREAENYVMLKHGLERNATMGRREADKYLQEHPRATAAKIESILARDYAGVATIAQEVAGLEKRPTMESANEIAAEYIRETEGSAGADAIKALWDSVRNATTFSLRKSYRSGQLSKKGYDELIARWQYYVPLRGHDATTAEDLWDYSESGTLFSNPIKKAKGRTSRAESPFAFIEQQAESAITSGNKNALKATILNLAESGKTGKLFSIGTAWYVKSGVDMNGNVAWEMAVPAWNEDPDIYAANVQAFEDDMKMQEAMGEATHGRKKLDLDGKFIKPSQALEHEIVVKRNGEDIVIYVNGNPDLARSINGANRTVYDNWAFNSLRAATRGVAAAATSLNPLFVASNFSRDLMYSSFKLTADNGVGFTTRYLANIPKMAPALNRMLRGKLNLSNESDKMAYEFMMNGGPTGYVTVMDLDRVNKQMQRELKKLNVKDLSMLSPKKQALLVKHATAAVADFFGYLNEMAENVVRLSTYATARQSGQSVAKAVETAKNVTVDFNSRGAGGWGAEVFNSLWMFTNVGLQAFQNFAKTTKEHPFKVAAMLTMYMLSGFMQPWWIDLFCDEETAQDYARLSDWDRRTNFCIPDFKGHFIKVPISQELRAFHGVGDGLYQAVRGQKDIKEVGLDFASSMADVVPFGQFTDIAEVGYTAGLPTLAQPFFQWRENTNFMGAPVRNRYKTEGGMGDIKGEPGYAKVRVNRKGEAKAPAMLMDFAQFADVMTGGDGVNKGWFSPNPDELEHFARGYFGGLYTTIMGTANSLEQIATTGEVRVKDTPLKRFVVSASELDNIGGGELSNYYKLKDKAGEATRQYSAYLKQVKEGRLAVTDFKAKMEEIDYRRWKHVDDKIKQIDKVERLLKSTSGEEQATIDAKAAELKRELLNEVEQYDNNNKK